MYKLPIKENCIELKAKFKKQYASITDEDLQCDQGRKEEMLGNLRQKLGITRDELHEIIVKL